MSNMSYCRFQNTLADLQDCENKFQRTESVYEADAAVDLYRLCATIVNSYDLQNLERRLAQLEAAENEGEE